MDSCSLKIQEMKKMVISDEISDFEKYEFQILKNTNFKFASSPMKTDELSPRVRISRAASTKPV